MDLLKGKYLDADLTLLARKHKKALEEQSRLERQITPRSSTIKGQVIEADIRLLERQRQKKQSEADRLESYASKPIQSVQKTALQGDIKLLERKRESLLKDTERLMGQYKPVKIKIEQARLELSHIEELLIQAQEQIGKLAKDKEIIIANTTKHLDSEYEKVKVYRQQVLQDVVITFEKLDAKNKKLSEREAQLEKEKQEIIIKSKYIIDQEEMISAKEFDFRERETVIAKQKHDIAETREVLQKLVAEQESVTAEAKRRSKEVLDSADAVEQRLNGKARLISKKEAEVNNKLAEVDAREKRLFDLNNTLHIKEINLEQRERSLRVNLEQFKKGKL